MKLKSRHVYLSIALFLFWLALCGDITLHLIILGLFSSIFSVVLFEAIKKTSSIPTFPPMGKVSWLTYLKLMLQSMVLQTLSGFKRLGSTNEEVVHLSYELRVKHPLSRLMIANAITLSPGMITVNIEKDLLKIICFSPQNAQERKNIYLYLDALQDVFREVPSK